jgi:hypothetical protein
MTPAARKIMPANFARSLGSHALLLEAKRRRAMGDYSRATLGLYTKAWELARSPKALLQLCLFRHELGYHLPPSWHGLLGRSLPQLHGTDFETATILRCRRRKATQAALRRKFEAWLSAPDLSQIAVVGNGANLLGTGQASLIEACSAVVRFNHWQATAADVGRRTDLWVRSPLDLQRSNTPHPHPPPRWIAASGPDMASRRHDWENWSEANGGDLLSIPLHAWRGLVRELQAPPSAGVLTLGWLRSTRGTWEGIRAYGFGYEGGRYHAVRPKHRPSHRHDWEKESAILRRWKSEGLKLGAN